MFGQILTDPKLTKTTSNFAIVQDSIVKLLSKTNSIIIKTCDDYSEFYLTKDSLNWKGHFIKSLLVGGVTPSAFGVKDGIAYESKPMLTLLISFNADSLYKLLVKNKINNIKQLTEGELENTFNQVQKSPGKNMRYGLPGSSHDCNMTIVLKTNNTKQVSYRNVLVSEKKLHSILTLKTFYKIRELLAKEIENYNR